MKNIKFHIFGIPDGFDIYQEFTDNEVKNYYQCFYDESIKDNTRFSIHRNQKGDVSYTYLKYHLFSSANRPNAFIGLSVVFSNGYFADISSLYNLLEHAYNSILNKGILLEPVSNGSFAKFIPKKFEDAVAEVKRIESFILDTLGTKAYMVQYLDFDTTFKEGKQNAVLKIPFQLSSDESKEKELNELVVEKLKLYSWLSLSPDYIEYVNPTLTNHPTQYELDEELDPLTKLQFVNDFERLQSQVLAAFEKLVNKTDSELKQNAERLDRSVKTVLFSLQDYGRKQQELQELLSKYSELASKIDTLLKQIELSNIDIDNKVQKGGGWQRYLAIAGGAIAAACIYAFFLHPYLFSNRDSDIPVSDYSESISTKGSNLLYSEDNSETTERESANQEISDQSLYNDFCTNIQKYDFKTAVSLYNKVVEKDKTGSYQRSMDDVVDSVFNKLLEANEFNVLDSMMSEFLSKVYTYSYSFSNLIEDKKSKYEKSREVNIGVAKNGQQSNSTKKISFSDLEFTFSEVPNYNERYNENSYVELDTYGLNDTITITADKNALYVILCKNAKTEMSLSPPAGIKNNAVEFNLDPTNLHKIFVKANQKCDVIPLYIKTNNNKQEVLFIKVQSKEEYMSI